LDVVETSRLTSTKLDIVTNICTQKKFDEIDKINVHSQTIWP